MCFEVGYWHRFDVLHCRKGTFTNFVASGKTRPRTSSLDSVGNSCFLTGLQSRKWPSPLKVEFFKSEFAKQIWNSFHSLLAAFASRASGPEVHHADHSLIHCLEVR